jgi:uncharacterized protein (TIGR02118 family)
MPAGRPKNADAYKLVSFARFRPDMDPDEAARYWREEHGPLGAKIPGLLRYEQNLFVGRVPLKDGLGDEPPFDGYAALWFAGEEAFLAATETALWEELDADGAAFLDTSATMSARVEERVIVDGSHTPYKVVAVANFRADLKKRAASRYWTEVHGPLGVKGAPGFTRYVQNHVVGESRVASGAPRPTFDGFAEHWLADRNAYLETVRSPDWDAVIEDGFEVFDMGDLWEAEALELVVTG